MKKLIALTLTALACLPALAAEPAVITVKLVNPVGVRWVVEKDGEEIWLANPPAKECAPLIAKMKQHQQMQARLDSICMKKLPLNANGIGLQSLFLQRLTTGIGQFPFVEHRSTAGLTSFADKPANIFSSSTFFSKPTVGVTRSPDRPLRSLPATALSANTTAQSGNIFALLQRIRSRRTNDIHWLNPRLCSEILLWGVV